MHRIVIGGAQFGLNYGISNKNGQPDSNSVYDLLNLAYENNIRFIDTAHVYGNSEDVIGNYLLNSNKQYYVITKLISDNNGLFYNALEESIRKLNVKELYACLMHYFSDNDILNKSFLNLKKDNRVKKIGFSIYFPHELEYLLKNYEFDCLQLPYNIFDRRFEPYFDELKKRNIEIHIRSVFLQGLVFVDDIQLSDFYNPIKVQLNSLCRYSEQFGYSVSDFCLGFVLKNPCIDKVVLGFDSEDNLHQNLKSINNIDNIKKLNIDWGTFICKNEEILVPSYWPK